MAQLFNLVLYQPLFNLLVVFYLLVKDVGLAIILLTILIKIILYPFSLQAIKAQKSLQDLQPKIEEIKRRYSKEKEKMARAMIELYQKEKISPFSSCLPTFIQLPFLIAVFMVFRDGFKPETLDLIYNFIPRPQALNPISFGFLDLSQPNVFLAFLAGISQFFQTKMLSIKEPPKEIRKEKAVRDESFTALMNKQMLYLMPIMTLFISLALPSGLVLYWFVTTLLMIFQQYLYFKKNQSVKIRRSY